MPEQANGAKYGLPRTEYEIEGTEVGWQPFACRSGRACVVNIIMRLMIVDLFKYYMNNYPMGYT